MSDRVAFAWHSSKEFNHLCCQVCVALVGFKTKDSSLNRDGVGAGQIQEVNDTEVSAIQKVLKSEEMKELVPGGIKLTFIIVSKRINTR